MYITRGIKYAFVLNNIRDRSDFHKRKTTSLFRPTDLYKTVYNPIRRKIALKGTLLTERVIWILHISIKRTNAPSIVYQGSKIYYKKFKYAYIFIYSFCHVYCFIESLHTLFNERTVHETRVTITALKIQFWWKVRFACSSGIQSVS